MPPFLASLMALSEQQIIDACMALDRDAHYDVVRQLDRLSNAASVSFEPRPE